MEIEPVRRAEHRSMPGLSRRERALRLIRSDLRTARNLGERSGGYWTEGAQAKMQLAHDLGIINDQDMAKLKARISGESERKPLITIYYWSHLAGRPLAVRGTRVACYEKQEDGKIELVTMTIKKYEKIHGFRADSYGNDDLGEVELQDHKRSLDAALAPRKRNGQRVK